MFAGIGIAFTRPEALVLILVLVPLAIYLSRTSLALLRRGRRRFSLVLRVAIILLLVTALAGAQLLRATDALSVVFLVDRSDSISAQAQALQAEFVRDAVASKGEDDASGVIVFGADALVDQIVQVEAGQPDLASAPGRSGSNLAEAIRLGLAIAPADTARRLVLLSDGLENTGSAEWAARLAAAHGATIDVVPLPVEGGPEVWVGNLKAPSPVRESERVSLEVEVSSSVDTTATLILSMNGSALNTQTVRLVRGVNTFVQQLPAATRGFHTYSAQVVAPSTADTRPENNRYSAFSLVLGKPRVLLVEGKEGEAEALRRALAASMDVEETLAASMPADARVLAGFEGFVLVNVPAPALPPGALDNLLVAVRDLGRGLVVVGGDESYAAGGYFRTPLEAMLPVDLNLPSKLDIPSVGMAIVIDRSGSMDMAHGGATGVKKIELAKEAAYQAVAQLSDRDYVGVIIFDDAADWVVEMQPLGDPLELAGRIGSITSGGGTNIYAGLSPAVDSLIESRAKSKHIVLLTDGVSAPGDYDGLLKKMSENGVTLSAVAVGVDADLDLMQYLAARGNGRYYFTEDGNSLPQIFTHESHLAARSYIIEHPFAPERTAPSPVLEGLGGLPPVLGYVGTSQRPGGQVVLVSDAGDPLLAHWQYGLGRVVAWTSDAKGQWAAEWVAWSEFPRFWSQAIRWAAGAESAGALQPQIDVQGGKAHVTVEASAPGGSYLNDLMVSGVVVSPDLISSTVQLRQSAAGRYEGEFPAGEEGAYLLRLSASGEGQAPMLQTLGVVVPYSPEYRGGGEDSGLLSRVAGLTGGRVLDGSAPSAAFEHNLPPVSTATDLWPLLLFTAIILLPFDIGARRVGVSRGDVSRALEEVRRRLGIGRAAIPAPQASTPAISALFDARSRARERTEHVSSTSAPSTDASRPSWAQDLQLEGRAGRVQNPSAPVESTQANEPGDHGESSLAARLRRAREQRR